MRLSLTYLIILVQCCFTIFFYIQYKFSDGNHESLLLWDWDSVVSTQIPKGTIVLSLVVCESHLNLSLNVVKSMLLFTREPVHLVIFADDERRTLLNETLTRWQNITAYQFNFELHNISFPEPVLFWLNMFRKCSSQRLFLPELLPHVDALIYVDTDTLFLGPIEELWSQFHEFNATQITALALEETNPDIAWYPRFAKHPFYGEYGVNAGVMLMNLTRMREFGWKECIKPVIRAWNDYIPWGDQDIINIIVSHRTAAVRVLDCRYNYRVDHCQHGAACAGAARGIFLLHGSRDTFHRNRQPAFQACCEAIAEHQLGSEPPERVLSRLDEYISRAPPSPCGASKEAFLRVPSETLRARWQNITAYQFNFELHNISFPEPVLFWLNMFRKCSSQRLFLPELLPHVDALIYVDTDTLFLGPIEELWSQFHEFNTTQITALALEETNPDIAWYPRFAKHPFYGEYGVNAGVMLMNLTRMREFGWKECIKPVIRAWNDYIPWGDQDIINIIVSHRTAAVRGLDCRYNYRVDHCQHGAACAGAARGIFLLHGSRDTFHRNRQPAFQACCEAIAEHQLGSEPPERVLSRLDEYISRAPPSPCGASKEAFLRVPSETLRARYHTPRRGS